MGHAARTPAMTAAEFLVWEAGQATRHEFVGGEVFAMAGAEDRHVTVALNVAMACGYCTPSRWAKAWPSPAWT
jgi:hypothetical protein